MLPFFRNPGKRIQIVAIIQFFVMSLGMIVGGIVLLDSGIGEALGIVMILVGPAVSYVINLMVSGFGSLVENSEYMSRPVVVRSAVPQSPAPASVSAPAPARSPAPAPAPAPARTAAPAPAPTPAPAPAPVPDDESTDPDEMNVAMPPKDDLETIKASLIEELGNTEITDENDLRIINYAMKFWSDQTMTKNLNSNLPFLSPQTAACVEKLLNGPQACIRPVLEAILNKGNE